MSKEQILQEIGQSYQYIDGYNQQVQEIDEQVAAVKSDKDNCDRRWSATDSYADNLRSQKYDIERQKPELEELQELKTVDHYPEAQTSYNPRVMFIVLTLLLSTIYTTWLFQSNPQELARTFAGMGPLKIFFGAGIIALIIDILLYRHFQKRKVAKTIRKTDKRVAKQNEAISRQNDDINKQNEIVSAKFQKEQEAAAAKFDRPIEIIDEQVGAYKQLSESYDVLIDSLNENKQKLTKQVRKMPSINIPNNRKMDANYYLFLYDIVKTDQAKTLGEAVRIAEDRYNVKDTGQMIANAVDRNTRAIQDFQELVKEATVSINQNLATGFQDLHNDLGIVSSNLNVINNNLDRVNENTDRIYDSIEKGNELTQSEINSIHADNLQINSDLQRQMDKVVKYQRKNVNLNLRRGQ